MKLCNNLLLGQFLILFFYYPVQAIEKDSNIVVSSAIEFYSFDFNKKTNTIEVNCKNTKTYRCNDFRVSIPVAIFYDHKSAINNIETYVGKSIRSLERKCDYYSQEGIFYSDAQLCYFDLPFEKQGSTSRVSYEKTISDPRYFTNVFFTDRFEVEEKTIAIKLPRWMKVTIEEKNFAGYNIQKTKEYDTREEADMITYTIRNLRSTIDEESSPGITYIEPHLLFLVQYAEVPTGKITYFNALQDQYNWYNSLLKEINNDLSIIDAKAKTITAHQSDDIGKIKAVLYWMYDNIRYIAFEDGIAGFQPEEAHEVLRKKYGDCKGMAHLTKWMLKSLGYDARLCWIGTNHIAYTYSTPSLAVDNHMICAVFHNNQTYFLDPTQTYLGFNEYAERIQGREVLIENGDQFIKANIPVISYLQNQDIEKGILTINGTDLSGKVSHRWTGESKEYILSGLNSTKREKATDSFMRYLSSDNKNYLISNFTTSDLNDFDSVLLADYDIVLTNTVSSFGDDLYIDLDNHKEFNDFSFDLKKRESDYWFDFKEYVQVEMQLTIPAGYEVTALPSSLSVINEDYEFVADMKSENGLIIYKKNIILKNTILQRSKMERWNSDIEQLKSFYNEQIVLSKIK